MEYKLPDLMSRREEIRSMHPDSLAKMKNEIQSHLTTVVAALDEALEKNIESCCDICADYGYAYMDLPPGWGWMEHGTLICSNCVQRWVERFGEAPTLNREGEIAYEHSSVPEDSAHWGQANFEFV